jgi:hypothetical protein
MGFPRLKVKARSVAPSKAEAERVSLYTGMKFSFTQETRNKGNALTGSFSGSEGFLLSLLF